MQMQTGALQGFEGNIGQRQGCQQLIAPGRLPVEKFLRWLARTSESSENLKINGPLVRRENSTVKYSINKPLALAGGEVVLRGRFILAEGPAPGILSGSIA
jgi:hypothetical protein